MLENLSCYQKMNFLHDVNNYFWDEHHLFRLFADNIVQRCVPEVEILCHLQACHSSPAGGHHAGNHTLSKNFQSGYYWPIIHKYAYTFTKACD